MTSREQDGYSAFISYRHVEPDRRWAKWLHSALETYRVPKLLRQRGLPERLKPVFRDEEELSAAADLSEEIKKALDVSDSLVVVCSPRAVESKWINKEIDYFRRKDNAGPVLALLIEGQPAESYPLALRKRVLEDGSDDAAGGKHGELEPLAADVRPVVGEKVGYRRRMALLRLMAPILGCGFDDLRDREQQRRVQRLTWTGVALAALAVVLASLTAAAAWQRQIAIQERTRAEAEADAAQRSLYFSQVHLAQLRYEHGDIPDVLRLLEACPPRLRHIEWRLMRHAADVSDAILTADPCGLYRAAPGADGRTVLACGRGGAGLWNMEERQRTAVLCGGRVFCGDIRRDGRVAVTAAAGGSLQAWSTGDGKRLWSSTVSSRAVETVAFSGDGNGIAWAARDGNSGIVRATDGQPVRRFAPQAGQPVAVAFSPDGQTVAVGSSGGEIFLFGAASGRLSGVLRGCDGIVYWLAFAPDGRRLASASADDTVRLWDAVEARELRALRGHANIVTSVAFSPDGRTLASSSWDRSIRLWDASSGRAEAVLRGHTGYVNSVAWMGRDRLVTAGLDGTVRTWSPSAKLACRTLARDGGLRAMAASMPDGRFVWSRWDDTPVLLDACGVQRAVYQRPGGREGLLAMAMDFGGRLLAGGCKSGEVVLWNGADETVPKVLVGHRAAVTCLAVSDDAARVISGSGYATAASDANDGEVRVWSVAGESLLSRQAVGDKPSAVSFAPGGKTFAVGYASGQVHLHTDFGRHMVLRPHRRAVQAMAFSPDGKWLASGGVDGEIVLQPVGHGAAVRTLPGHSRPVNSLSFSRDGMRLLSSGEDAVTRLWDLRTGAQAIGLASEGGTVWDARFAPGEDGIIVVYADGTLRLWQAPLR